jgi:hypothetical protein
MWCASTKMMTPGRLVSISALAKRRELGKSLPAAMRRLRDGRPPRVRRSRTGPMPATGIHQAMPSGTALAQVRQELQADRGDAQDERRMAPATRMRCCSLRRISRRSAWA